MRMRQGSPACCAIGGVDMGTEQLSQRYVMVCSGVESLCVEQSGCLRKSWSN